MLGPVWYRYIFIEYDKSLHMSCIILYKNIVWLYLKQELRIPGPGCFRSARNCTVVVKVTRAKCLDTDWPLVYPSFGRRGLGWRYRIRVTIESIVNVQAAVILYGSRSVTATHRLTEYPSISVSAHSISYFHTTIISIYLTR